MLATARASCCESDKILINVDFTDESWIASGRIVASEGNVVNIYMEEVLFVEPDTWCV